jgi:hypothetical protein
VLEQSASLFQTFSVAAGLGSQVMLGETLGNLGLGQHAINEPSPHGIESIARASLLVEVTFATPVAEQEWRQHRAYFDRFFDRSLSLGNLCIAVDGGTTFSFVSRVLPLTEN